MRVLGNVAIIVLGVVIASFGEIKFEFWGFVFQIGGIVTEALRLVMVQRLLSSGDFKMDPLVSLYYYAPACAVTNALFTLFIEGPRITMNDIYSVGPMVLLANALVAFLLNVSSVLLVGSRTPLPPPPSQANKAHTYSVANPSLDRSNLCRGPYHVGYLEGHLARLCIHAHIPRPRYRPTVFRLLYRPGRARVLQARRRQDAIACHGCPPTVRRLPPEEPRKNQTRWHCGAATHRRLGVLDVGPDVWWRVCAVCEERRRLREPKVVLNFFFSSFLFFTL